MDPQPTPPGGKLRLMCSYGGQILPRPRTSALFYAGGDTRILSFHRQSLSALSSFCSHLSAALSVAPPFHLRYQLPNLPLDSLVSLSSDDDLHALLDEHARLSPTPYRIRLFLFPPARSGRPDAILHPKTEAWFFDALKSAKIMEGENSLECGGVGGGAESVVLETSSSFGSTSSSASLTNLPPLRAQGCEDHNDAVLRDGGKVKLSSSDTVPCDNTVSASIMSHQQNISYQDPMVHVSETRANVESIEAESRIAYISSGVTANNTNMDLGYASFPQFNQVESPHLQFVQAPKHFLPIHPSGLLPVPSCQPIYPQQLQPLQHLVYYPNQPRPVYLVPIGNMPPTNLPIAASGQASLNLNASHMNFHVSHNPEGEAKYPFSQDFVHVTYTRSQPPEMDSYPMHHQSQNVTIASRESPKLGDELEDDIARVQIYKSQPPPPTLRSKHQTMSKATTNLLSEALAQLHTDTLKQQTETSQPQ